MNKNKPEHDVEELTIRLIKEKKKIMAALPWQWKLFRWSVFLPIYGLVGWVGYKYLELPAIAAAVFGIFLPGLVLFVVVIACLVWSRLNPHK